MDYDRFYRDVPQAFGRAPERILRDFAGQIPRARPVLDIGVGQGRNAVYLARRGLTVLGIDPSRRAVDAVNALARRGSLPLAAERAEFDTHVPRVDFYSAVLIFGLIQILDREGIERLAARAAQWTAEGSLIFVTAFSTDDPACLRAEGAGTPLGRNCYVTDAGEIRTYLEPGEVTTIFPGFQVLHHWNGLGPSHRHGSGPEERHAMIECVLQR